MGTLIDTQKRTALPFIIQHLYSISEGRTNNNGFFLGLTRKR